MAELSLHAKPVASIFHLLDDHENDITYSISRAWPWRSRPDFWSRSSHKWGEK
jgi:hypothetical protein